jgi:formylglycine-generating enzyme required for sulfatase activity/CHAT domain-containing protein/cytochrome c-type biogenesis protein CcmH/NrfG
VWPSISVTTHSLAAHSVPQFDRQILIARRSKMHSIITTMSALQYLDFDLQIDELTDTRYRARVLYSPAGHAEGFFALPFSDLELENFLLRIGRPRRGVRRINSPEMNEARKFGSKLYDAVFQGGLQSCLLRSIDHAAHQGQGIRLRLRLPPSLLELPWEYLYDTTQQRFFAHSVSTPIVRYLELPQSLEPLTVAPPLNVLVMIASPSDYEQLDVEAEWQKVKIALAGLEQRGLLQLTRLATEQQGGATLAALQRQLRRAKYHIFHFIGHGGFDQQTQEGVLLFEDEDGRSRLVSGNYLGTLLYDEPALRLAILNACEGARTARNDPFAGVAQQLVRQGIPAVIAMQFEITDKAAIALAREFYDAVVSGYPVDGALAEARKALFTMGNDIEWGTPVLYLRATDGRLFDVAAQPPSPLALPNVLVVEQPQRPAADAQARINLTEAQPTKTPLWRRWGVGLLVAMLLVVAGVLLWQWLPNRQGASPAATSTQRTPPGATPTPANTSVPATSPAQASAPTIAVVNPVSRTIWLAEAKAAVAANDHATGKRIYEQLLLANPEDLESLLGLARALHASRADTEALRTLAKAFQLAPADPNVNLALGTLYYEAFHDAQSALDHLTRAIDQSTPAQKRETYLARAYVYHASGEYEKAIADLDEIITPNSPSDDYVRRAESYRALGDEEAAERNYTAAIDRAPSAGKYYLYRADFYAQFNRVEQAVSDYDSFLRLRDPDADQGLIDRAESYLRLHSATPSDTSPSTQNPTLATGAQFTNAVDGAVYVYVPAGEFTMGLDEGGFDEKPQHEVSLDAFWIMQTEVTNEQYEQCVEADVCTLPGNPAWGTDEFWAAYVRHPVTHVTWEQASTYAAWAGGRLPTEAEWEKAARGTDGRLYPWGNAAPTEQRLNFNDPDGTPQPVGSYPDSASPYGALDMAGNVWEWVADWYDPDYYGVSPGENPSGPPDGERRVLRGGAYNSPAYDVGAFYRSGAPPTDHWDDSGFRIVQEVTPN